MDAQHLLSPQTPMHPAHAAMQPHAKKWLALVFVLHAILGANLGLSVDEAHYALYAAHPALSYFDHPPLVGWVQWPLVALGASVWLLRLLPGMVWLGSMVLVYRLAWRLCPNPALQARAAWWSVVALLLAPLLHILGIGLLPDTLLMLWGTALMLQTLRLQEVAYANRPMQWLLLGALLGLAGLSKYTAIFTALAVALCLLQAHGMALLRKPWLWAAVLLALAMVSPVGIWNAQNQWVSFAYQTQHAEGGAWQGLHLLRFVLLQLLAFGPLLLWAGMGLRGVRAPQRLLFSFFAIPFAVLAYLSGGGSSLPHWTAPAWVACAPFAGMGLATTWAAGKTRLVRAAVLLQVLACVALPALLVSGGMPFMQGKAANATATDAPNPFADLHGWEAAGARALQLAAQHHMPATAVQNWTLASRIGWYARPLPVYVLEDRFDQFDLWAGDLPVGGSALLVDWSQMPYVTPLGAHGFAQCTLVDTLHVQRLGYPLAHFDFYACSGWSGTAQPRLKPASQTPPAAVSATPPKQP